MRSWIKAMNLGERGNTFRIALRIFKIWLGYDIRIFGGFLEKILEKSQISSFFGGGKKKYSQMESKYIEAQERIFGCHE